jgi:hypothetical protein
MNRENTLEQCLQIWKEVRVDATEQSAEPVSHIPMHALYRMAGPGGIEKSSDEEVDHLSLCPECLDKWVSWRLAIHDAMELNRPEAGEEDASMIFSCGLREAAASLGASEPLTMRSSCGRFILGLLPQVDDPDRGLVTLEAAAEGSMSVEGRRFIVRDRNGFVVLDGKLYHGRLARTCERLSALDLSAWTLVVDDNVA